MDLTIEVMLPARGAVDFSTACNPTYRVLAPIAVYPRKNAAQVLMTCTGYLHCANVPEHPSWPAEWTLIDKIIFINSVLAKAWDEELFVANDRTERRVEKRQWSGNANALNTPDRRTLLQDRQLVITWNQCKNLFRDNKRNAGLTEADFLYTPE